MQIIKKDISWLLKRVPDFHKFFEQEKSNFNGGYLAGGFVRKMILAGSAMEAKSELRAPEYARFVSGDIDFFYYKPASATTAAEKMTNLSLLNTKNPCGEIQLHNGVPNSRTGFAYETRFKGVKYQFIYKNTGTPEEVLARFDISNCKIATDGESVWMVEDWEKLEENKHIRIDNYAGQYLLSRMKKYIRGEYSIYPEQKTELLHKMLNAAKEYCDVMSAGSILMPNPTYNKYNATRYLVGKTNICDPEELLLFYDKLGLIYTKSPDYNKSTVSPSVVEDYALHMYKKRIENKQ